MWTIPKGEEFTALKDRKKVKVTADEDLIVLYKGKLLELEKEASRKAVRRAKFSKRNIALVSSLGSLLALLSGLKVYFKRRKR